MVLPNRETLNCGVDAAVLEADTLTQARGTIGAGVKNAGVLHAAGGNARLLNWTDDARAYNEVIARRLLFIVITVDDALNAYTVFKTLNARGLELSATDLLKNHLFSKVRVPTDLQFLRRRWLRSIQTVSQDNLEVRCR